MTEAPTFPLLLNRLAEKADLSEEEAFQAFDALIAGSVNPAQIAAFLMALRVKGETVDEIVGAARSMRGRMIAVQAPPDAIDTCGTGGDHSGSFNVSTAAAFVIAGCGVPVAKHGNSALSSRSGSADTLTSLGVGIGAEAPEASQSFAAAGIAFLMAPYHHPATRSVAAIRRDLGVRTIFNLLGPLTNPAGVKRQIVGVFAPQYTRPLAEALRRLGSTDAWVVHGDGLDELTTTGTTTVAALEGDAIRCFEITPEQAGLTRVDREALIGGSPTENAAALRHLLNGQTGPLRDIVLLNAAAGLIVGGRATTLREGIALAGQALDDGAARRSLERLVELSQKAA